jgi:lysozyme
MMKRCHIARGAYHFITPDADAAAQARVFLEQLGEGLGELPPVADVERPLRCEGECCNLDCDAWVSRVRAWVDAVGRAAKRTPMIYTMRSFWTKCLCGSTAFQSLPLWLAREDGMTSGPDVDFGGWSRWTFLQDRREIRFGKITIDVDLFRGTRRELDALAGRP